MIIKLFGKPAQGMTYLTDSELEHHEWLKRHGLYIWVDHNRAKYRDKLIIEATNQYRWILRKIEYLRAIERLFFYRFNDNIFLRLYIARDNAIDRRSRRANLYKRGKK